MDYEVFWTHRGLNGGAEKHLPVAELKDRGVYRVVCRNIYVGVYRADRHEFIGIREKFGKKFLDGEYHWDTGKDGDGALGTALPVRLLEIELPAGIPAVDHLEPCVDLTLDVEREVFFDKTPDENGRGRDDYKPVRGWVYRDTGELLPEGHRPGHRHNDALFDFLTKLEAELATKDPEWKKKR